MSRVRVVLVLAAAVAVTGVAASRWAAAGDDKSADAGQKWAAHMTARADVIARKVSKIRGLKIKKPIAKGILDDAQLRQRLLDSRDEDSSPAERAADAAALKRWGLVPLDMDLDALMLDLMTEQIAGFYDPREKKLYVTARPDFEESWAEMVLAHEIDHALQDQHFDLVKWMDAVKGDDDASAARQALVEGDGVALMLEYSLAEHGQKPPWDNQLLMKVLTSSVDGSGDPQLDKAPLIVRRELIFPYLAGLGFVASMRRDQPWSRIDQVFAKPPRSTEQIIHPELYLSDEGPDEITARPPPAATGIKTIDDGVWGEAGMDLVLESHGVDRNAALTAAAGWGGDREVLYGGDDAVAHPDRAIAVSLSTWDTDQDAAEMWDALGGALDELVVGTRLSTTDDRVEWLGADGRVTAAERHGRRIAVITGAPLASWRGLLDGVWQWPVTLAPGHAP